VLTYSAQAEIGGKLASVGSRLVQSVARKNADDFFSAFARRLGGAAAQEQPLAPTQSAPARATQPVSPAPAAGNGLTAPVPAWLVVFGSGLGIALGYCLALLAR